MINNKGLLFYSTLILLSNNIFSQKYISGKLIDNKEESIQYANICFKENNIGTTTDLDGNFTLVIPNEDTVLNDSVVFMHLNYKNRIIAYKDLKRNDSIVLDQDYYNLSEVAIYAQYAQNSYRLALSNAKENGKSILLFFTASYCGPCRYYKNLLTEENNISKYLKENYILIFCDIMTKPGMKLKRLYGAGTGVPNFVVITPDERIIAKHSGGWWEKGIGMEDEACLNFLKKYSRLPKKLESLKQIRQTNYDFSINEIRKRPIGTFLETTDENLASTNWRFMLNLGIINITNLNDDIYNKSKIGYDFGLLLYYNKKGNNFSCKSGLIYSSEGGKHSLANENLRINYLEVPLNLSYLQKNAFMPIKFTLSPYVSYGITAKNKYTDVRIKFGSAEDQLKRWDYGIIPGITIPLGDIELFTGYKIGLQNISNINNETMYNRGYYIRMTLKFFGEHLF